MSFLGKMNAALGKSVGYEVRRAGKPAAPQHRKKPAKKAAGPKPVSFRPPSDPKTDRLLSSPVFVLSPVRSGSTLLRLLLDGHSKLHAPHELHIRRLTVGYANNLVGKSMEALDLERSDLEHLLWDRVMHRELVKSGKEFLVDKTPSNAFAFKRIAACWPDARYVFLLRHPMSIASSWQEAHAEWDAARSTADALRYMNAVERARAGLSGLTVRYEDLTADPATELQRICDFLKIGWEPEMLEYGKRTESGFQKGLGDWTDKIRSGSVQSARPLPASDEIPEELRNLCAAWGYLGEEAEEDSKENPEEDSKAA